MRAPILESVAPITPAFVILAEEADAVRPTEKVSVSVAAARHRVLDNKGGGYEGPWLNDMAPHLVEPMDALTDDRYRLVAIMGGAQIGKSEIGNNWILQAAIYAPSKFVWLQADKVLMGEYVREKINPMITLSPELRQRLLPDVGADNVYRKEFKRGMIVSFIWPVPAQLRMRSAPNFVVDDYDDVPPDIGGQGDAIVLLGGRQISFQGRGKGLVMSSPSRGRNKGIEALVASGTDKSLWVKCLECGEPYPIDCGQLDFDRTGSPEDAAASAHLVCPSGDGCYTDPRDKIRLLRSGEWAGPEQTVTPDGEIIGPLRQTDIASYRFEGVIGFEDWKDHAKGLRAAEIQFERTQDEGQLRAFVNTHQGKNYVSEVEAEEPIEPSALKRRAAASNYELGQVPEGFDCLTAAVDCQGKRFAVLVMAWKVGGESCVVDRYDILALSDGVTAIDPGRNPEHFHELLDKVIWRRYPMAHDPSYSLPILNTVIDRGGQPGVTENVSQFWYHCHHKDIPATALTPIHGGNNPKAKLLTGPTKDATRKARKDDPDEEYWVPNVHRVKDIIDVRLRRDQPGPGYIGFPRDISDAQLAEITAEEKVDGLWQRKEGDAGRANETWDLLGYAAVAFMRLGGSDTTLTWVPAWARPAQGGDRPAPAVAAQPQAATRITRLRMN